VDEEMKDYELKYQNFHNKIKFPANNIVKQLEKNEQVYKRLHKFARPSISKMLVQVTEISTRMNQILRQSNFTETFEKMAKGIKETEEDIKVFKAAMVELGYPPHDELDIRLMRSIAQDFREEGKESVEEYIDEFMCEFYSPAIIQKISSKWEQYNFLKKRLPLLRSAIRAHNIGMYDLVVPSVISQFEGVIVDAFDIKGNVNGAIQEILYGTLLLKENSFVWDFDEEVHSYYSQKVLVGFAHGKKAKSEISRHAILHGGDTDFGLETNSLKVILLFDYIVEALNDMDEDLMLLGRERVKDQRAKERKRKQQRRGKFKSPSN
jgi:hypothetical protein